MKILVVGNGGREHALVWKLSRSPRVKQIFCAPGNAGTGNLAQNVDIPTHDFEKLLRLVKDHQIDLTVVGPEAPLAAGIVDRFQEEGVAIFGPSQAASQLESSKIFAKEFCDRHQIPTADYAVFTDAAKAKEYLKKQKAPVVVKADGLASGKGVSVCATIEEGLAAIDRMMVQGCFGTAGSKILIEECLKGPEVSFIAMVDGKTVVPLSSAQDHKRLLENDAGPNTGGMGAFSPSPLMTTKIYEQTFEKILLPTVAGMEAEGNPFVGFLYAGLMLTASGPKLLEFNVRFGDPEAQVILPRLKSDLAELMLLALRGNLEQAQLSWEPKMCATVVMASKGYPGPYEQGFSIQGLPESGASNGILIFHAGTKRENGKTLTHGGRVLAVSGLGKNLKEAVGASYKTISGISWNGAVYRKDIGGKYL